MKLDGGNGRRRRRWKETGKMELDGGNGRRRGRWKETRKMELDGGNGRRREDERDGRRGGRWKKRRGMEGKKRGDRGNIKKKCYVVLTIQT
ncbi:hypothetical protein ElyMa_003153800 [Elysia marginata]|uniref:Uncharacterized protein n=1 Tax=Elysia marginata TaxID=1093978 RepID=A0AAV4IYH8_9GAST|nr:hypothetical protein ElyMa_003153800 [Elysia marginata]